MLEFKGLCKSFSGRPVLRDISFTVGRGEIVFVIGKSGTGKSVLLRHVVGLLQPDSGEVWLDGNKISDLAEAEYLPVRRQCAMVFQFPALLDSLTVYENLAFGLRAHRLTRTGPEERAKIESILQVVGVPASLLPRLPSELSVGMQKQVAIARSAVIEPKYLLFDEPTTGLDPIATRRVHEMIRRLARELGVTALVVSHDLPGALEYAHRIVLLEAGSVVAVGTPQEIREHPHPVAEEFLRCAALLFSSRKV